MLDEPAQVRHWPGPREGWLSVVLLGVMLMSLVWAVQAAGWLEQLEFLGPVALWALLAGLLLGMSRLSVAVAIPLSAVSGAAIVLWSVGGEYYPELGQLARLDFMRALALDAAFTAYLYGTVQQALVMAIVMGILVWVTAYTAAFAVFRRHHVLDAILLIGAFLVVNLVATVQDLFGFLVLFAMASLLLWLRAALVERRSGWEQRRVTENVDVPASIMRSGVLFTAGAIGLAWLLTSVAVAAPLTTALQSFDQVWVEFATQARGLFEGFDSRNARPVSAGFGPRLTIGGIASNSDDPRLTLISERPYYLGAVTYDHYTGRGWSMTDGRPRSVAAEDAIFPQDWSPDRPLVEEGFRSEIVRVCFDWASGRDLFTPGFPIEAYAPIVVTEPRGYPTLGRLQASGPLGEGQCYDIRAAISEVTQAQLATATTDYEPEIRELYLDTGGISEATAQLARDVTAGATNPHDQAELLQRFLRNDPFVYDLSVAGPSDISQDLVDYFLFDSRRGSCTHYASAMVLMSRSLGIPARLAVGYAPGERVADNEWQVVAGNSHAWAELYFPGYGWQIFEATRGIDPKFARQSGDPSAVRPPPPGRGVDYPGLFEPGADPENLPPTGSFQPIPGGHQAGEPTATDASRFNNGWIFLALVALAVGVGAWRWFAARRRFRFLAPGDRGWARMKLAAERAGIGRSPAETFYEYAGWLEAELPTRASEIRTIAEGKVWSAYSGRSMSERAIEAIERAWDRLRFPLARLAIRRRLADLFGRRI